MAVPQHLNEAAARLDSASARIDEARGKPPTLESLKEWLAALTDYATAVSDLQTFNNESIHEKLHEVAGRAGLPEFPPASPLRSRRQSAGKGRKPA